MDSIAVMRENSIKQPIRGTQYANGPGTGEPERFFAPCHWHGQAEIVRILKGTYLFEVNLKKYRLKEGDICIFNSGDLHQVTGLSEETEHQTILFDPGILEFVYADEWEETCIDPFLKKKRLFVNVLRADEIPEAARKSFEQLFDTAIRRPDDWYVSCKIMLLIIFHQLVLADQLVSRDETDAGSRKIERFKQLVSYIEEHYAEPIQMWQLAELVSCNSQYLSRFFKEISGRTPTQYIIDYRVEQACHLLADEKKPLASISAECGFDNVSYFIRKFREKKGCTPGQYRSRVTGIA